MKIFAEREAEEFLEKKGFPVAKRIFVSNYEECLNAARKIGFPVALKIVSKKILHKSDVHGVKLDIKNKEELNNGFNELKKIKNFEGVLVLEYLDG